MIGKIKIYGAGGAGTNIAAHFIDAAAQPGYAEVSTAFVDTSRSNLKSNIPEEQVFLLDNVDGSGKIRKENAGEISNVIKQVLLQHKPLDFNIVVFSASGGSGSVAGPLLIGEMLERDIPVVGIVVGSDESIITCQNTLNTLKSLEAISTQKGRPVVIYYDHNQRGVRRSEVDTSLVTAIAALAMLASRQNAEMDSRDLVNWLHYHKVSDVKPQLSLLSIFETNAKVEKVKSPISIASLYRNVDEPTISVTPDYHCTGYTEYLKDEMDGLHFVIAADETAAIAKGVQKTLQGLEEVRQSRVSTTSLVSDDDEVTADGLVL